MAAAADGKEKSAGGGGIVVPLIILTVIGGGLGVGSKLFLFGDADETEQVATVKESPDVAKKREEKKGKAGKKDYGGDSADGKEGDEQANDGKINEIIGLDPIIASLAKSSGAWVRLETAIVFKSEPAEGFTAVKSEITSDILAYLRTVSLDQIQGASGLEYLTDDLQDIARVRSQGAVDRLVIKGLIFE